MIMPNNDKPLEVGKEKHALNLAIASVDDIIQFIRDGYNPMDAIRCVEAKLKNGVGYTEAMKEAVKDFIAPSKHDDLIERLKGMEQVADGEVDEDAGVTYRKGVREILEEFE